MQLSEIFIYPVKSLRGISLQSARLEPRGLAYDRRWMLIDETGHFFTQREFPEMALLITSLTDKHLIIEHATKSLEKLLIPLKAPENQHAINVQIWDDNCKALLVSREADQWLSEALDTNCRIVYMPEDTQRFTDPTYSEPQDIVSFADGFPFLIIGQASLDDLNERLEEKIQINRFRPNFVFTGGAPFEEDSWKRFRIGDLSFRAVKPCARCQLTTIHPETATFGKEPLRTLSQYRLDGHKILFGMNVCWDVNNEYEPIIKIGDTIKIL
ncbi:MAG: MOSC domain-containing protein [Saprospiraceae bacterium]|nr:MOSC domain-containing protein [Saprospiraceae bacterium]